ARRVAQLLRRHRQQDRVVAADLGGERRHADALVEPHARQARALAALGQRFGASPITSGDQPIAARACDPIGERPTPGASSDNGNVIKAHCASRSSLSDGGDTGAAAGASAACGSGAGGGGGGPFTSPSGQRACGGLARVSVRPSASRSAPAQAIIAPLSVHRSAGGTTSVVPASNAIPFSAWRMASLAATPP